MNSLYIIAFTHRNFTFDEIGLFHLEDEIRIAKLKKLKIDFQFDELMYLSTCNRVEFIIDSSQNINSGFLKKLAANFLTNSVSLLFSM